MSPIRAYFSQTEIGESRLWSWLAVIWFALFVWFYGQLIIGVPMIVIGLVSDPNASEKLAQLSGGGGSGPIYNMATLFAFALPILAIVLWLLRNQFSGYGKTVVLKIAAACAVISFVALVYLTIEGSDPAQMEVLNEWISKYPLIYALMLLMFVPITLGIWIGQKYVHNRTIRSLLTAASRFRWGRLFFAMIVFWAIALGFTWIGHISGLSTVKMVFDPSRFWMYLPITLIFIPMQSATEEIMLRGYLNQGLGHFIKNPWIVFIITSAGFAALHLSNPEIAESSKDTPILLAISGYFFFGMFACILTYIDGGLESAIGMHAANNIFAASIVGYDNSALPVPTVFHVPLNTTIDSISVLVMLSALCFVMYLTRRPIT